MSIAHRNSLCESVCPQQHHCLWVFEDAVKVMANNVGLVCQVKNLSQRAHYLEAVLTHRAHLHGIRVKKKQQKNDYVQIKNRIPPNHRQEVTVQF